MSRGLGKMQRLILASLDDSKKWMKTPVYGHFGSFAYLTGRYRDHFPEKDNPFLVRVNGDLIDLKYGVYDLSATLNYLAEEYGKYEQYVHGHQVSHNFLNSFWRASRRLIQTGYLIRWQVDTNRIVYKGEN